MRFIACIFFFDTGSLAAEFTQVIKLCTANLAAADNVNVVNDRCVQRENAFDTNAKANFAYRNGLANAAVLAGDDNAFKNLKAFLVAFLNADVHLNGVAGLECGNVFP